jgi:hypothetical protein
MQTLPHSTASSWDSYKPTLIKVLAEFHPKTVFEYGPGVSTLLMQDFPSIDLINTVEHDVDWFNKWKNHLGNKVSMFLEEDLDKYPYLLSSAKDYDLYFVDGREREICLEICNRPTGIVILHDAERESYQPYIKAFRFIFMEDGGHTCVMTNNEEYETRLERIFSCE